MSIALGVETIGKVIETCEPRSVKVHFQPAKLIDAKTIQDCPVPKIRDRLELSRPYSVGHSILMAKTEELMTHFHAFYDLGAQVLDDAFDNDDANPIQKLSTVMAGINQELTRCIKEMSYFDHNTRNKSSSWDATSQCFEKFFSDLLHAEEPDIPSLNNSDGNNIPDSFFEDEFDGCDIGNKLSPKQEVKIIKDLTQTKEAPPLTQAVTPANIKIPMKRNAMIVETSPVTISTQTTDYEDLKSTVKLKYLELEAACSAEKSVDYCSQSITTSLAAFIDDRSEITAVESSQSISNDQEKSFRSSAEMMAFYQRTAYESQFNPIFAQAPKLFDAKSAVFKLTNAVHEISSSATEGEFDANDSIKELDSYDWPSEIELLDSTNDIH